MPSQLLAILDEGVVEKFCNGTASERRDAELKLQSSLRGTLKEQREQKIVPLLPGPVFNPAGDGVERMTLSMSGVATIHRLQQDAPIAGDVRIVQIEFAPNCHHTLVEVGTRVHHVSMQNGKATEELRP